MNNTISDNTNLVNKLINKMNESRLQLCDEIVNIADFGFVVDENIDNELSIISLLINALDNIKIYNKVQFNNIITMCNKVNHGQIC